MERARSPCMTLPPILITRLMERRDAEIDLLRGVGEVEKVPTMFIVCGLCVLSAQRLPCRRQVVVPRQFVRGQKQHRVRRLAVDVYAPTPRYEFFQNLLFSSGKMIAQHRDHNYS